MIKYKIPPGETIKELLIERNYSKWEKLKESEIDVED